MIIKKNTTWQAGDLINIKDVIQIAPDATLTIKEGVTIQGGEIQVFGNLNVEGSLSSNVVFNNTSITFGNNYEKPGRLDISYSEWNGGKFLPATGNASYGSFTVSDSKFNGTTGFYLWYPQSDSYFTRNIFKDTSTLSVGTDQNVVMHIDSNSFANELYDQHPSISVWASYGDPVQIHGNTFSIAEGNFAIELPAGYNSSAADASGNYWGTVDQAQIKKMILDARDNLTRASIVNTADPLLKPSTDAPITGLVLRGAAGEDILSGTKLDDMITGYRGDDTLNGNNGNDTLAGGDGVDLLNGGAGDDLLWGGNGSDRLIGQAGADRLNGQAGNDTLSGGDGEDLLQGGGNDDLLWGGNGNDRLFGQAGSDRLNGQGGNDLLNGADGDDTLNGNNGNDTLSGGDGADQLWGGGNEDFLWGGNGDDRLFGQADSDRLNGQAGDDLLGGGGGNDTLNGHNGSDTLVGADGADVLYGGGNGDVLTGGNGSDALHGQAGNDRLIGGRGADILTGGNGADHFVFSSIADSTLNARFRDTITDFRTGHPDRIDLRGIDADTGTNGNQAFDFIGNDGFSGEVGQLRFYHAGGNTIIMGDVDGDGRGDFSVQLLDQIELSENDFFL